MKRKDIFKIIIIIIIALGALIWAGTKLYVSFNYDLKILTNNSTGFYIFSTSHDTYYLVNSSLGIKTKTKEFDIKSDQLSYEQLQQLKEIEKIDDKFIIERQYSDPQYYVFFYENYIFYTRYYGEYGGGIPDEDWKDMKENIYEYNIDTKEIKQIKRNIGDSYYDFIPDDVEFDALNYLYPNLKEAIASKCDTDNRFSAVFYDKGRIFFSTYFAHSSVGEKNYLYEYLPSNNKIKKISNTRDSVVNVEVVE